MDNENLKDCENVGRAGILESFSRGFKNFLERKKMSTKEIALKLNITDSAVSSWKYGRAFPDIPNYLKLVEIGLSPFDIMGDKLELQARINDCEMRIYRNDEDINFMRGRSRYSSNEAQSYIDDIGKENQDLRDKIEEYKNLLSIGTPLDFHQV